MKNIIPVIIAVILGMAGVYAVKRVLTKQQSQIEQTKTICVANEKLTANTTLTPQQIGSKKVGISYLPKQYIAIEDRNMLVGQKIKYDVAKGDYLLLSQISTNNHLSDDIGEGEWGCQVTFADATLLKEIYDGDEIAIMAMTRVEEAVKQSKDADAKTEKKVRNVAFVLYPRIKVLKKGSGNSVFLSLKPDQAIAITTIQQTADLYPLLRKTSDTSFQKRSDSGVFEMNNQIEEVLKNLPVIKLPQDTAK